MNSLFKNDWYKSGIKLTILIAAIFGLIVLSYVSAGAWGLTTTVYYAPTDTYVINPDSIYTMNRDWSSDVCSSDLAEICCGNAFHKQADRSGKIPFRFAVHGSKYCICHNMPNCLCGCFRCI